MYVRIAGIFFLKQSRNGPLDSDFILRTVVQDIHNTYVSIDLVKNIRD